MTKLLEASNQVPIKTVLIVDDTPENITILGGILAPAFNVRVANSGARALAIANATPSPDLILLDIMMPIMDGYEVLAALKSNVNTQHIPVIFVTALESQENEARGLELGAVDYIIKPIKPAIALARVRAQLGLKESRDQISNKNLWLEAEVQLRINQTKKVQAIGMRALANLTEARDDETGNHILRTQRYIEVLAQELAKLPQYAEVLTPEVIESYTKAAPLHDIGKVGIPDDILHKPGKHTPEEFEIMKTHAAIGANAISRALQGEEYQVEMTFLNVAMDIAHYHHEKWDGSGYPEGLKHEAIPLSARLMAIADVFDALITKRIYKPAFTLEHTIQIIVDGRGKHFDPDVVDAFLLRQQDFMAIAAQYTDA